MKYIDADRLRSEIEKRKQIHFNDYFVKKSGNPADYGASNALAQVLPLIDSLQQEQPEADLEKEMKKYFKGWTETEEGIACHYQYVDLNTCHGIARHFYELGLNARKEE